MKKLIKLALSGLTILSGLILRNYDPVIEAYAANSKENNTYSSDFLTFDHSDPINLYEEADYDELNYDAEEGTADHLNSKLHTNYYLDNTGEYNDLISTAAYLMDDESKLVYNSDNSLSCIQVDESNYLYAYYETIKPIIYFDSSMSGKQNIEFFVRINTDKESINSLINHLEIKGSLPLLKVNDINIINIYAKGINKGFYYSTPSEVSIDLQYYISQSSTSAGSFIPVIKVTMPYLDSITKIESLSTGLESELGYIEDDGLFELRFHSNMADKYYFYVFDLCGFSASQGHIIVDNSTYVDYFGYDSFTAELVSMKFMYTRTEKTYGNITKKATGTTTTIGNNVHLTTFASEIIEVNFDPEIGMVDGLIRYWCFEDQWLPGEYDSGEIKILSITWHPREQNDISDVVEIHDYSKVNIHKYSFNASKSIRTYHYDMSGYMRGWSSKDNNWLFYAFLFPIPYALFKESIINYQCYAFDFYFDKQRTQPIENIQKVVIKYQCGYAEPNTENDGWYPNTEDEKKRVVVRTINLANDRFLLGCALDDYGMVLTNSANKVMATDDYGNEFSYVIYKEHRVNDINTYITKMAPLEIYYETENQEMVRMVGNSKGLHVVLDPDGVYRVYYGDGTLAEGYAPGVGDDGTMFVGKDLDGDGKISTWEAVDSDQGRTLQEMDPYEPPWWSTDKAKKGFTIGTIILIIVVLIVVYAILKPQDFAFICKAIGNGFKNLFKSNKKSSSKKKKKAKTKKKSKGKK